MHSLPSWFGLLFHPATWIAAGAVLVLLILIVMRKHLLYVATTILFLVWDASKRVRGWWRRNLRGGSNG